MFYVVKEDYFKDTNYFSVTTQPDILKLPVKCSCEFENDAIEIATALNLLTK